MIKKVLITAESYYPISGGIQQYLRGLAYFLHDKSIDVEILCQYLNGSPEEESFPEARVFRSRLLTGSMDQPFNVIKNSKKIADFIKGRNYDVVYANNHNSLAVILACKIAGLKVVYGCHGAGLLCPLKKRLLRKNETPCWKGIGWRNCTGCGFEESSSFLKYLSAIKNLIRTWSSIYRYSRGIQILNSADARLCNSKMTTILFKKKKNTLGIALPLNFTKNTELGFYPVDPKSQCIKYSLQPKKYLLLPGRVHNVKGHHHAVLALTFLPEEIKLVCMGAGGGGDSQSDYYHFLIALIKTNRLQDRVIFTGNKTVAEMRELYSGAAITLVPSIWIETFGYVTIESLGCATPVILTDRCGSKECVDETCARIISPGNPMLMANTVQEMMPCAIEMGMAGREKMVREFDWNITGLKILNVLENVVSGFQKPPAQPVEPDGL
jgi:glycosyltransferase involved in cell wall biosynthesis